MKKFFKPVHGKAQVRVLRIQRSTLTTLTHQRLQSVCGGDATPKVTQNGPPDDFAPCHEQ